MKIAMIINTSKTNALSIAERAIAILTDRGAEILLPKRHNGLFGQTASVSEGELFGQCDVIVVVGGDGTIIHTAKKAAAYERPVLGINAGRLGFLAGLEPEELSLLPALMTGDYTLENRMMLSVTVGGTDRYTCLNDAVISGRLSRMIDIHAGIGEETLTYRADGLIAATPTGSTAYSLSAGGPVIDPGLESITLTPICPQSLFARSVILGADQTVRIDADAPEDADAFLTVDGEEVCPVHRGAVIEIRRAENERVQLIKLNKGNFLSALSEKFNLLQ